MTDRWPRSWPYWDKGSAGGAITCWRTVHEHIEWRVVVWEPYQDRMNICLDMAVPIEVGIHHRHLERIWRNTWRRVATESCPADDRGRQDEIVAMFKERLPAYEVATVL